MVFLYLQGFTAGYTNEKTKSATFKAEDRKRFLLLRLNELIQKNYELLDLSPRSMTATDEERHTSDNEEDLSIVLIDDDDDEDEVD